MQSLSTSGFEFDPASTWLDLVLTPPLRKRVDVGTILCGRVVFELNRSLGTASPTLCFAHDVNSTRLLLLAGEIKPLVGAQVPSRTGDQISAERNILRCSAIRARDTGWLEGEDGLFDQVSPPSSDLVNSSRLTDFSTLPLDSDTSSQDDGRRPLRDLGRHGQRAPRPIRASLSVAGSSGPGKRRGRVRSGASLFCKPRVAISR